MSIKGVDPRCWVMALFIRSDGERFLLGDGAFQFIESQQHFSANEVDNTVVSLQGSDGVLLAGQTKRATPQSFDGYVGDATVSREDVEQYRRDFLAFFAGGADVRYEVVYIFPDGSAIKRQRGFISDAPAVPELWQVHPEYHVSLNFEDPNYYTYAEDADGNELYGQEANISLYNSTTGGFEWDSVGLVWQEDGLYCLSGLGGAVSLNIKSTKTVYPIWTVNGLAETPILRNLTTNTWVKYNGRVGIGQTLVVDMLNQTALVDGTNVLPNMDGSWINFAPGVNRLQFITENDNASDSTVKWAEVVA